MRPTGSTDVASMHSMAAPDSASEPRCTMCHSLAWPCSEEYWHIGETTTRLGRVTLRSVIGENSMLMGTFGVEWVWMDGSWIATWQVASTYRNTVENRICLKRSTGSGSRWALASRQAPCSEDTMKPATSSH